MARNSPLLHSDQPTAVTPAAVHIGHVQLRDLVICPRERGIINYVRSDSIIEHNILEPRSEPCRIADLRFTPNTITSLPINGTDDILLAAGGQDAEIHLSLHQATPSSSSSSNRSLSSHDYRRSRSAIWQFYAPLPGSINNSVLLTSLNLTRSHESSVEPRVAVSNNDCTVKFYDVPIRGKSPPRVIEEAGILRLDVPVNHSSISPDGRTLLSVGDSPKVYLHRLTGGSRITFQPITTLTLPPPSASSLANINYTYSSSLAASFSTTFSSDGSKFAVASQDGVVVVWDVRSTKPLKVWQTDKTRSCGVEGSSGNGSGSGWLSDDPWDWTRGGSKAPGWGVRSVKFGPAAGKEVMMFTEHTSIFHVIDARTFETEEIIRIPDICHSSPPLYTPLRTSPPRPRSSRSFQPSPPQRVVRALEDTFRISSPLSRPPRHTTRSRRMQQVERDEDVVIIPALGDRAVEHDVQQLLGRHGIRTRHAEEEIIEGEVETHESRQRDRDNEMEVDELESDCLSSHTPSRSSSPSPSATRASMSAPVVANMPPSRHRSRTITARDLDAWEHMGVVTTGDKDLDLAGCCFDPTGAYLYVASVSGVAEWSVRGAEKRWWGTPTAAAGDEWM